MRECDVRQSLRLGLRGEACDEPSWEWRRRFDDDPRKTTTAGSISHLNVPFGYLDMHHPVDRLEEILE